MLEQDIGAHPVGVSSPTEVRPETRPPIGSKRFVPDQVEWVPVHVSTDRGELVVRLDQDRSEPSPKDGAIAFVAMIEPLGVAKLDRLHHVRQSGAGTVQQQMEVVRHQAVRMHVDVVACGGFTEQPLELEEVVVSEEDVLAVGSSIHHVVPCVRHVGAVVAWHVNIVNQGCRIGRQPETIGA